MKAMLVEVNGKRVCVAAITTNGHANASISWFRTNEVEGLMLNVAGVDGGEPAIWPAPPHIQLGDEVRIRIIDTDKGDIPLTNSTMVSPAKR